MGTLYTFLFFCSFEIWVFASDEYAGAPERGYPKKYNPVLHRHMNILNRRYLRSTPDSDIGKKGYNKGQYTVFPPVPGKTALTGGFPGEQTAVVVRHGGAEQQKRVKKVLPDYSWKPLLRKRRSPVADPDPSPAKAKAKPKALKKGGKPKAGKAKSKAKPKPKTLKTGGKAKGKKSAKSKAKPKAAKAKGKSKKTRRQGPVNGTNEGARRLIAALDASIEAYPYTVSIQKAGEHWCSGALLNQRVVITTANCVWKSTQTSFLRIRACSRYVDTGGQTAGIQEVKKHPGWDVRRNPDCDVALLYLDRFIRFSHGCHSVDLPNHIMLPAFDDAWITSWGAERRDGIYEKPGMTLQVYHARLIERDKCNNVTQRYGITVTNNFICLAQAGRRAPCTRDTGAPAVSDGVVWGLASWGIRKLCGTERFPAMFSYLASTDNLPFLTRALKDLMSDERHYPFPDRYQHHEPDDEGPTKEPQNPFLIRDASLVMV